VIGFTLIWGPASAAEFIEVKVDNEVYGRYTVPLNEPMEITLDKLGHNIVVIDGYQVYIKEADCPDQLCVRRGAIEKTGTMLVCLPNKVTVEIIGKRDDGVDILSY